MNRTGIKRQLPVEDLLTPALPRAAQELGFCEWLMRIEEQLGYLVHSKRAARLYNSGVAVMDAVVQLKD